MNIIRNHEYIFQAKLTLKSALDVGNKDHVWNLDPTVFLIQKKEKKKKRKRKRKINSLFIKADKLMFGNKEKQYLSIIIIFSLSI